MLPLAGWVMRGRGQAISAIVIALLTSLVIWPNSILAAAVIALLTLRTGSKNGIELWFWSLVPALLLVKAGSYIPLCLVTVSLIAALLLRNLRQWSIVLMVVSASGLLTALLFYWLAQSALASDVAVIQQILAQAKTQVKEPELYDMLANTIDVTFMAGMMGISLTISAFLAVVLARYWQAALYNPGGFQQEFHSIKLEKLSLLIGLGLVFALIGLGNSYLTWVWIVLFPMLIAGIALFHVFAKQKNLRTHWYVIFYVILLIGDGPKLMLILLTLADSFFDFRKKLSGIH